MVWSKRFLGASLISLLGPPPAPKPYSDMSAGLPKPSISGMTVEDLAQVLITCLSPFLLSASIFFSSLG